MHIVIRGVFHELERVLESEEVIVLTGCRQTGKTTTLKYFFDKINSPNKLFLDLENILNRKYFEEENYEAIRSALEFLGLDFNKKSYVFLDEIQYVKNLPSVVKYLKDHYKIKFFLTGSASFYLKNLFSESLSGRKYIFHLYPLTFREFTIFKGYEPKEVQVFTEGINKLLSSLFDEYLKFGGFPGVVLKNRVEEKRKKLQDIFSSYFEMEVEKLKDFAKLKSVRDTLLLLFLRSTSLIDVAKLAAELELSRITLREYLDFFEKTFFFDFIKPYSQSRGVEIRKRAKVYPVDVGLAGEMGFKDMGGLLEIAVYQNIKVNNEVNYYRKKTGQEIDFILNGKQALEVKNFCHKVDIQSLQRKISSLAAIKQYKLVTLKKQSRGLKNIEWAPQFCLRLPNTEIRIKEGYA